MDRGPTGIMIEFIMRNRKLIFLIVLVSVFYLLIPLKNPVFNSPYSTVLFDNNANLLNARIADDEQWRFPGIDSLPEKYKTCLLYFEDEYFYYHPGVNPVSLFKALMKNIKARKIKRGASTISMQCIRISLKNPERTIAQKIKEIFLSFKLELIYSKDEILKMYADHAPFGGNIVGLSTASWFYFQRAPKDLSWAEASALAVLPNNPSSIFPGRNKIEFKRKRDFLLKKLYEKNIIDSIEYLISMEEPLPDSKVKIPNKAEHLLQTCITNGYKESKVYSSIDPTLQANTNRILESHSENLRKNEIHNAAAIIIEIKSGKTLAYVGNSNASKEHAPEVDIIQAPRSPGSLLKPFLYAASLENGLILPNQLLPDIPLIYRGFAPKNFDKKFRGAIQADHALASSLNVPFVFLLRDYGYQKFHSQLQNIGMNSLDKPAKHYGLSLILGGAETTLWEITSLYAGLIRSYKNYSKRPYNQAYGKLDYSKHTFLNKAKNFDTLLGDKGPYGYSSIHYTLKALKSLNRPHEESGWKSFESGQKIAWKTGTSYGFKDAWAIGMSDDYVIGVWVGNADGEGRPGLIGTTAAAPLLFELFRLLNTELTLEEEFGTDLLICHQSGMKAGKNCFNKRSIRVSQNQSDSRICQYHLSIKLDSNSKFRVNSSCYDVYEMIDSSWFVLPPVHAWYYKRYHPEYLELPKFMTLCRQESSLKSIELIYPKSFSKVYIPKEQDGKKGSLVFEASHQKSEIKIFWHLDNLYLGFTQRKHQMPIQTSPGIHRITLIDEFGNELVRNFEVLN